jgi:hypothetical protein
MGQARGNEDSRMSDMIRLRASRGTDECNHNCVSYKVNKWGCVTVPADAVPPLLKVGGFSIATEATEGVDHATLSDVLDVAWHLPSSIVRSTLLAILRSPNSMSHLTQSIAFT